MFITFFSLKNLQAAVSIFHSFYLLLLHTIKPWECMRRRTKEGSSRSFPRMCYVKGTAVATTENKDERMHGRTHVHSLLGATRRKNPFACGFCRSVAAKKWPRTWVGRTKKEGLLRLAQIISAALTTVTSRCVSLSYSGGVQPLWESNCNSRWYDDDDWSTGVATATIV